MPKVLKSRMFTLCSFQYYISIVSCYRGINMHISSPTLRRLRDSLSNRQRKITPEPLLSRHYSQPPLSNIVGNPQDFSRYTSGRWLWNEKQQLQERYREFNILELQKVAIQASSSERCLSMAKIGEGSYNKSFKLIMDTGKTVIARIPNPNAGPTILTTASEVATMDLVSILYPMVVLMAQFHALILLGF